MEEPIFPNDYAILTFNQPYYLKHHIKYKVNVESFLPLVDLVEAFGLCR